MSHEITATDNMFSVREMPWHGLGVVLDHHPTREEAQAIAHPWEPVDNPIYRKVPSISEDGTLTETFEEIPGGVVRERSDNGAVLGAGTLPPYIKNEEMYDIGEAIGKIGTDIYIETGGSLEGGKRVWLLLAMAEPFIVPGDPNGGIKRYFALQDGKVGNAAFRGQGCNVRIVCANTSRMADDDAKGSGLEFVFRHTSKVSERIEEAKKVVALWRAGVEHWQAAMEMLINVPVYDSQVLAFIHKMIPEPPVHLITDRTRTNIEQARGQILSILNGPTSEGVRNTAYGLYQAGLEYHQHYRATKGSGDTVAEKELSRRESYFKRAMLTDAEYDKKVLTIAKTVAGV